MVFVGFVFMTLLDLGLLVLFGIQPPQLQAAQPQGLYLWWVGGSGVCPARWLEGGWQRSDLTAGEACCLPSSAGDPTMLVYAKCNGQQQACFV